MVSSINTAPGEATEEDVVEAEADIFDTEISDDEPIETAAEEIAARVTKALEEMK